jgi:chitodextrinase
MKKKVLSFLVLLAMLLNISFLCITARAAQTYKIVVLGSSTAAGAGVDDIDSAWVWRYTTYLRKVYPNFSLINLALGGIRTYSILPTGTSVPSSEFVDVDRNITKALSYMPNGIIINLPSNDASANIPAANQLANYDIIIRAAHNANVPVWVTTPQPTKLGKFTTQIQLDMVSATFSVFGDFAIDFWTELVVPVARLNDKYDCGDGIHPNSAAHKYLFQQVVAKNIPDYLMYNNDTQVPSIPLGLVSSNITGTSFKLSWSASTDNVGVCRYDVYKNGMFATSVTTTSAILLGLTKATTYSMTVIAIDAAGNQSALSNVLSVTTLSSSTTDTQRPSIPTGLSSSNITGSSFNLTWTASTDNVGVIRYDVYKNGTFATSVSTTSASLLGLTNATTYSMTVIANDAVGNQSAVSNQLFVKTIDTQAPSIPTGLSTYNITSNSFKLSWIASTDNVGVSRYDVYKNGIWATSVTTNSATLTGLSNGTSYSMTVIANDAAGNESSSCYQLLVTTLDTQSPSIPTGLSSSDITDSGYTLSWTASTDNIGVYNYDVYRNGTWAKSANTTSVTLAGLTNATTYSMTVIANDAAGNRSSASNQLLVKTLDTQAPTVPTGLTSSNITGTSFTLSWTASTDNTGVSGYDVYKNGAWLTSVASTSNTLSGLTNATSYSLTVIAKDAAGNYSVASNQLLVKTPDTQSPTIPMGLLSDSIKGTSFIVSWTASTDNVEVIGYDVYKNGIFHTTVTTPSATLLGLTNETTYNITVIANDAAGNQSAMSNALSVTTLSSSTPDTLCPSIPTGLSSSNITGSSFTLSWVASADSVGVIRYDVYKNGTFAASVSTTSAKLLGLTNATTYNMTVIANDAAGNQSAASNQLIVKTPDTQSPSIPTGLSSSNITGSGFTLLWTASTDNVGITSYDVYKNGIWVTSVASTSATLTGLTNTTTYSMTVIANDAAGNRSSACYQFFVTTLDTQSPSIPTGLSSSNITGSGFTLSWTASTDNVGVFRYDVYKNGAWATSVSKTSVTLTGLTNATTYNMTVIANDATGNQSATSNQLIVKTPDTQAPTLPTGLSAYNLTGTSFTLSWSASTDNVGVSSYDIYKNGTWLTSVSATSVTFNGLTNATTYTINVIANDATGNRSAVSNHLLVTTLDTQAPTTPTDLSSDNITGTGFTLLWTPSTDNVGVTGYDVYKNGAWATSVPTNSVTFTGLTNATTYIMSVIAKDAAGNRSAASNQLIVKTPDTQPPTIPAGLSSSNITGSSFTLSWNASTDNVKVKGYDVYKNGSIAITVTNTSATFTGLTNATPYSMTVIAKDTAGNQSAASNQLLVITLDTQAPTIPMGLSSDNITGTGFTLSWTASTDNVGVYGYDVYKNDTLATSVTTNSAIITGLTDATTYRMTVIAKDAAGNRSVASNQLLVKTPDIQAPTIPMGLSSDIITGYGFNLFWTASTDNVGVIGYDVYQNDTLTSSVDTNSAILTGLTNATTYRMTVIAKDEAGNKSAVSNALSVTTLDTQAPGIPTGLSSDNITGTGFTISWTASTDNVGVIGYDVFQNGTLTSTVTTNSDTLTGLTNATTYNMSVIAKDAAGNRSAASNQLIVKTPDTQAPSVPMSLSSINVNGTSFTLSWSASIDNVGVIGYDVYKNDTLYSSVTTNGAKITGLTNATIYSMSVIAKDEAGNRSAASNEFLVKTMDTQAPSIPLSLSSSNITGTSFTLSWAASTDNVGVIGYDVYNNGLLYISIATNSVTLTGLTDATKYRMTVIAKDEAGNRSATSNQLLVKTPDIHGPTKPMGLASENITATSFTLSWIASTDNVGVSVYDVFKNGILVTSVTSTSLPLNGLTNATKYSMTVVAKDAAGNQSAVSNTLSVFTLDIQAPSIPTGLLADNITGTGFTLSWTASTDNVGVIGYDIYVNGTLHTSVSTKSVILSGLTNATTFSIKVIAKDAAGNRSAASNQLLVKTPDTQAPSIPTGLSSSNITGTSFNLSWATSTDNVMVSSYNIYQNGTFVSSVNNNKVTIKGLTDFTTYRMTVIAIDASGNQSAESNTLSVTTLDTQPPSIPINLTSGDITSTSFKLSWKPSSDNVGVICYDVFLDGFLATSITATTTNIIGLSNGHTYITSVVARDASGNISAESNKLSIETLLDDGSIYEGHLIEDIYPNPVVDVLNLKLTEHSILYFLDMSGSLLFTKIANVGINQISFNLKPGFYLVKVAGISNTIEIVKIFVN